MDIMALIRMIQQLGLSGGGLGGNGGKPLFMGPPVDGPGGYIGPPVDAPGGYIGPPIDRPRGGGGYIGPPVDRPRGGGGVSYVGPPVDRPRTQNDGNQEVRFGNISGGGANRRGGGGTSISGGGLNRRSGGGNGGKPRLIGPPVDRPTGPTWDQ